MYLVYRAPADKLTTAENNLTTLHNFFPFYELYVLSMQIYEKLILHVQIEQDLSYPVGRKASKSCSSTNSLKIICFAFKITLSLLTESNAVCTQLRNSSVILKQEFSPYSK